LNEATEAFLGELFEVEELWMVPKLTISWRAARALTFSAPTKAGEFAVE
jgi:hypothetical protein